MSLTELYHERELFDAEASTDLVAERLELIDAAFDHWFEKGAEAYEQGAHIETHPAMTGSAPRGLKSAFRDGWERAATEELAW